MREGFAFESHRNRITFDLLKQSSVEVVKKHLTEFLGRKFSDFSSEFSGSSRTYSVVFANIQQPLGIFSNMRKYSVVLENLPKLSGIAGIIRKLLDILNKIILAFLSRVCCSICHWKFPENETGSFG